MATNDWLFDVLKNFLDATDHVLEVADEADPNDSDFFDRPYIEAKQAIEQKLNELEKAYGGCHLCYGKGYHTKRVGTSSRYGNVTHDTIGYCSCDRGKQLEAHIQQEIVEARLVEAKTILNLWNSSSDEDFYDALRERIAIQAQAHKEKT